jgi:DNA-binding transcriptional regulator YiaG
MSKNGKMIELKKLRQRYGISRRRISVILGCSEMAVFRWESGRVKNPHPYLEQKLDFLIETLKKKEVHNGR